MRSMLWKLSLLERPIVFTLCCILFAFDVNAQCPTASGDEVSYGSGSLIGYVYDGAQSFDNAD